MDSTIAIPQQPKRVMLPVLVVLFLISYGLLTLLVVEQGRTIDSQRDLIRNIFSDTAQLNAMKKTLVLKQNDARARTQVHGQAPSSQAQAPSSQVPSAQSQSAQTPSSQIMRENTAKSSNTGKLRKVVPQKPPSAASDTPDSRRNVLHI